MSWGGRRAPRLLLVCQLCGSTVLRTLPLVEGGELLAGCPPCYLSAAVATAVRRQARRPEVSELLEEALSAALELLACDEGGDAAEG